MATIVFFTSIAVVAIIVGLLSLALDWHLGIRVLLAIAVPTGYAIIGRARTAGSSVALKVLPFTSHSVRSTIPTRRMAAGEKYSDTSQASDG